MGEEIEENFKNILNKLQQTTLQNERLKDDIDAMSKNDQQKILAKKYTKAKEYVLERDRIIETLNDSNLRLKNKNSYYLDCYNKWKKHAENLEKKVKAQQEEIKNLMPSKAKTNAFTELCKNYHYAKTMKFKKSLICRETQTHEMRLERNKENANTLNANTAHT